MQPQGAPLEVERAVLPLKCIVEPDTQLADRAPEARGPHCCVESAGARLGVPVVAGPADIHTGDRPDGQRIAQRESIAALHFDTDIVQPVIRGSGTIDRPDDDIPAGGNGAGTIRKAPTEQYRTLAPLAINTDFSALGPGCRQTRRHGDLGDEIPGAEPESGGAARHNAMAFISRGQAAGGPVSRRAIATARNCSAPGQWAQPECVRQQGSVNCVRRSQGADVTGSGVNVAQDSPGISGFVGDKDLVKYGKTAVDGRKATRIRVAGSEVECARHFVRGQVENSGFDGVARGEVGECSRYCVLVCRLPRAGKIQVIALEDHVDIVDIVIERSVKKRKLIADRAKRAKAAACRR